MAEFRTEQNRYSPLYRNPHMTPGTERGGLRTDLIIPALQKHTCQFPPNLLSKYQEVNQGRLPPDYRTTRRWYFQHASWDDIKYHDIGQLCDSGSG